MKHVIEKPSGILAIIARLEQGGAGDVAPRILHVFLSLYLRKNVLALEACREASPD